MHRPMTRLLAVLEILQARKSTRAELARRLEVDRRTVRRYVEPLRRLLPEAGLQDAADDVHGRGGAPYAVLRREGRWHLFGHCHLREATRLLRLDRVLEAEVSEETFERPAELDAPGALMRAVASGPWEYEVLLETGIEDAREQVPPVVASLEETEGGVLMRGTADDLGGPRACWRGCRARLP
jgi:predicted DNA-binding transcriptional regulator YafY